ncbi:MAG: PTS sugar transporter subunit IIA [Opitutaceae bacterium]|jgi:PTS system nitrogen regulatory IIA component
MYLTLSQIAESFGVSEKVVEDWTRNEQLPRVPYQGRTLFDRTQVATWAAARGLAAKIGFLASENPVLIDGWQLAPLLSIGGIWRDVPAAEVLNVIEKVIVALPGATPQVRNLLIQRARSKNGVTWAPVGGGFAVPHLSTRVTLGRDSGSLALIFLRDALPAVDATVDDEPVRFLFFFIAPSPRAHLDLLGRLSRTLSRQSLRDLVLSGAEDSLLLEAIGAADATSAGSAVRETTQS